MREAEPGLSASDDLLQLDTPELASMLACVGVSALVEAMCALGRPFQSLPDLLCSADFRARLGAMTVLEELVGRSRPVAFELVSPILARYSTQPPTVRGDLAYVLGLTGGEEARKGLSEALACENDPEVREALDEALSELGTGG
ncbi:MAG: hypothetical protein A2284_07525 [Deltaproteobacteria bacterium RIFOXYA12_FULL_61_11]|nr:MAG: hypothetical protein A2284_07525 [Deltaproteobacteria bacterium RIFOXYA12_FULL_61_11]